MSSKPFLRACAAVSLCLLSGPLSALEAQGTLQSVDPKSRVVKLFANGRDRTLKASDNVQVLAEDGKPLAGGLEAKGLTNGAPVSVTVNPSDLTPVLVRLQLGARRSQDARMPAATGKPSVGLKPLTELSAADRYKGEDGGLYGAGRNDPPPALAEATKRMTAKIAPLDAEGRPSPDGKIGLVSISMSNATQEYSLFKQLADRDPQKSPSVAVVDCAQGGQAMAEWVDPGARPWTEAKSRLARADVSLRQVQVIWVKLANKSPRGELPEHVDKLKRDTRAVLRNAKALFPNLRIAYLGSRIYAGYAATPLNPEPYAYEGAFAVRGLIREQMAGDAELACEGDSAPVPLLLWGPYFWADGTTPRKADGLVWERADLGGDGTHPSESGRRKVADQLLAFFKTDTLASSWFRRK
jgi:hypothetical protein